MAAGWKVSDPRVRVARLQAVVCILLSGLLLYNPFLSLIHSPTGLSVHHLARNRATVGSSELQHFSPVSKEITGSVLLEERTGEIIATSVGQEFQLAIDLTRDLVISPDFSSNLWFRPPPLA